ncbi:MAG: phospho-N-acetylmuramoyl-pentapeptide-transferase [Chlamydiales bacterium]|nr:phospho-N-acetylmuramoyl-pentapeptide-transferase [Chlamydiales bacterium]
MLLLLLEFFNNVLGVKLPTVFSYASTRMMLAAITTLLFTVVLGPRFIRCLYQLKTGQSIRVEDCPVLAELHQKKKDTPTMGGILILSSMLLSLVLWMDLRSSFTLLLFVTTIWLGLVGGYDDYLKLKHKNSKGLSGKKKLFFQMLLAALIALYSLSPTVAHSIHVGKWFAPPSARELTQAPVKSAPSVAASEEKKIELKGTSLSTREYMGYYFTPFFKDPLFILKGGLVILAFFITLIVITGASNAVNLTDGLDGLAAGCLMMVSGVLGFVAFLSNNIEISRYLNILYIEGSGEIGIYLFAMMGACLGFLWYNGYPAQVFMGDTGSLALGGVLGLAAVLLRRELLFALVGGVFVAETVSVILQVGSYKLRNRKRIFLCTPLHHHFEYKGWPETKVVLRFWIVSLLLAIVGMISLKFQ